MEKADIRRLLIANRGEIAVRIIRTCRELGIETVAVFSEADRTAPHVRLADQAHPIGAAPSEASYLNVEAILDAARKSRPHAPPAPKRFTPDTAFSPKMQILRKRVSRPGCVSWGRRRRSSG